MHDASTGTKPANPCSLVIFGAGGDLTKRLVVPSLYNLACAKLLPEQFAVVGVDLADLPIEKWQETLKEMTEKFVESGGHPDEFNPDVWNWLSSRMSYVRGDLNDSATYRQLSDHLRQVDEKNHTDGNYIFYLAVADRFFAPVIDHLGESKLAAQQNGNFRRVVVEKPFGHDLPSARDLDNRILHVLDETQTYRIDHFLGKETVQNIMMFRFANGFFEPVWSRDRIDHVQITVAETVGVEARGKFYETTGALRDMVPNHMFQLLAMTAMEAPSSFRADAVRSEKAKVIESVRVCAIEEVPCIAVRGQ
jgi:glucose-6-phosphate 1-dehydrogenase